MIPPFEPDTRGTGIEVLSPGIHEATLDEVEQRFSHTPIRMRLMAGLRAGLTELERAGCTAAYINGSFVTSKAIPGDFDVAWDIVGVDPAVLDSLFWDPRSVAPPRTAQKLRFFGEFLPNLPVPAGQEDMVAFFQKRREGGTKGIVMVRLGAAR